MHLKLLFISLITLFIQTSCRTSDYYTDDRDEDTSTANYPAIIAILAVILIQGILCFICYKNTQRIRLEAQSLRAEIGAEYETIKNAQFANMNQCAQFNYFLVYPNDPRFQVGPTPNNYNHNVPL